MSTSAQQNPNDTHGRCCRCCRNPFCNCLARVCCPIAGALGGVALYVSAICNCFCTGDCTINWGFNDSAYYRRAWSTLCFHPRNCDDVYDCCGGCYYCCKDLRCHLPALFCRCCCK
ncbi:unnamed protein product [Adineta steineri]|uniref:Uncharacterized protein n=1 Tax=Adineta steineri TaxID=433720 RepID=A0A815NIX4_9BILA|nr:unnamed protein product [Adineta steineri]CAF1443275.1 unnamed protein product [Adineta steineri]CAF3756906.1 unnamed protein product [Adineta steineri]CAF3853673.1 unnamed protein product [Adineta steineri]